MDYQQLLQQIDAMDLAQKIEAINEIKIALHEISPFKNEPVDCVIWKKNEIIKANDYNPNKVAPPEMQLLEISISNDGYTQPVVTVKEDDKYTVIDGFHRTRVAKESEQIRERLNGYTPITIIRDSQKGRNDRIASTIRHNRARGKHVIDAMSEIVIELKNRNWKNERIARELGMDEEEILRLCQITGLEELFKDDDFSMSWNAEDSVYDDSDYKELDERDIMLEKANDGYRTINTSDKERIFHTYDKWECQKAGFYKKNKDGKTQTECENIYAEFLKDTELFDRILEKVTAEWINSCEHYLTNKSMNRIAWLGQAAVCYHTGVPSICSAGWQLLNPDEQQAANDVALKHLNIWLSSRSMDELTMDEALSVGRQVEIY